MSTSAQQVHQLAETSSVWKKSGGFRGLGPLDRAPCSRASPPFPLSNAAPRSHLGCRSTPWLRSVASFLTANRPSSSKVLEGV